MARQQDAVLPKVVDPFMRHTFAMFASPGGPGAGRHGQLSAMAEPLVDLAHIFAEPVSGRNS